MKLTDYNFPSFSLQPELCRTMAEVYLGSADWSETREKILSDNLLQMRSQSSAKRMEMELRRRLATLDSTQIKLLAAAPFDSRTALAWLAACKSSEFLRDLAITTLREKLCNLNTAWHPSDYENYIEEQSLKHPEVAALKPSTKAKIQGIVKKMLHEAGLLFSERKHMHIRQPLVPSDVHDAIIADDRRWLAVFLVPDEDIYSIRS